MRSPGVAVALAPSGSPATEERFSIHGTDYQIGRVTQLPDGFLMVELLPCGTDSTTPHASRSSASSPASGSFTKAA